MPLYDYACTACEYEWAEERPMAAYRDPATCPECKGAGKKIIKGGVGLKIFKPMFFKHFQPEPIWIDSRHKLREECKRRGVEAIQLM